MAKGWASLKVSFLERLFEALEVAGAILLDAALFALWLLIDHLASEFVEWLHPKDDVHQAAVMAFRFIASGVILVLALAKGLSDVIGVVGMLRRRWLAAWNGSDQADNLEPLVPDEPM